MPADFFQQTQLIGRSLGTINPYAVAIAAGSLAMMVFWPRLSAPAVITRGQRFVRHVPGTIVALILATAVVALFDVPVETIGSKFGGIPQALPSLALPTFSWELVKELVAPTITIALLGAVESLLCARIADKLIDDRHDPNQELMAQGVANFVTPLFGGIPATGTIARTVTNVRAGAVSPIAGIIHALTLLAIVLIAAPLAANIPLAVLAAILMLVAWNMGEWHEFARLRTFQSRIDDLWQRFFDSDIRHHGSGPVGLILASLFFIYGYRDHPHRALASRRAKRSTGWRRTGCSGRCSSAQCRSSKRSTIRHGTRVIRRRASSSSTWRF